MERWRPHGLHKWEKNMKKEIIYSKKYPVRDYTAMMEQQKELPEGLIPTYDEMMERIARDITYEVLPERKEKSRKFIQGAIKISEIYEYDIEIRELDTHIQVHIAFDAPSPLGLLRHLIGAADDTDIFLDSNGRNITLLLEYYTHGIYLRGRRIYP